MSLAPMTRPDDLVPPIANPPPLPAAARDRFMNWRRLRCDFDIALALFDEPPTPPIPPRQILNQDLTRAYYAQVRAGFP